jgi:hypothetical protein
VAICDLLYLFSLLETIISWRDPEAATELALSFQEAAGCSYIWYFRKRNHGVTTTSLQLFLIDVLVCILGGSMQG